MFCALFLATLCGVPHEMWQPVLFYAEKGGVFSKFIATFARFYCLASQKLTASVVKAAQKIGFDLPSCDV